MLSICGRDFFFSFDLSRTKLFRGWYGAIKVQRLHPPTGSSRKVHKDDREHTVKLPGQKVAGISDRPPNPLFLPPPPPEEDLLASSFGPNVAQALDGAVHAQFIAVDVPKVAVKRRHHGELWRGRFRDEVLGTVVR